MTLLKEGLVILALLLVPGVVGTILVHRYSPPGFRLANREAADLRAQIRGYTALLVEEEWDALGRHEQSDTAEAKLDDLRQSYMGLERRLGSSNEALDQSVARLAELQDARNRRINEAKSRVPIALWVVLSGGVAIVIAMTWFTGSENFGIDLLTTVVLTLSLAAVLFLISVFNNPFQGSIRADPEPMERALAHFDER